MDERITDTLTKMEHRGYFIYYSDYRGLFGDEFERQIKENGEALVEMGRRGERNLLGIVDIRDCMITNEVFEAFKNFAADTKRYFKDTAVVGVTGLRKHLLQAVNKFAKIGVKPFDEVEAAKDWLVRRAG